MCGPIVPRGEQQHRAVHVHGHETAAARNGSMSNMARTLEGPKKNPQRSNEEGAAVGRSEQWVKRTGCTHASWRHAAPMGMLSYT
jgi:hypothetical protein